MDDFEWLDHTADIGIRVRGKTHAELFIKAAAAMFAVMANPVSSIKKEDKHSVSVEVQATDWDALLLDLLNELLSLSDCQGVIFTEFILNKLDPTSLTGQAIGASRLHFTMERDVKAVTAHGLKIHRTNKHLEVEVIFDV